MYLTNIQYIQCIEISLYTDDNGTNDGNDMETGPRFK